MNLNGTTSSINEDITYWINVTTDHVTYAAANCNRFHLAPKCSIGVVNSSHVAMKNGFVVAVRINNKEKIYTPEQYICHGNEKHATEEPAWLKQYYNFETLRL